MMVLIFGSTILFWKPLMKMKALSVAIPSLWICSFSCVCVFWGSLGGLWSRQYSISHLKNQQVSPDINQPDLSTVFATHIGELILFLLYSDPGLFVYCCDFSSTAVDLVKVSDRKLHYLFLIKKSAFCIYSWSLCLFWLFYLFCFFWQSNPEYDPSRCHAFVHDMSDASAEYPIPDHSLDVIVLIFVLSALHPQKWVLMTLWVSSDL